MFNTVSHKGKGDKIYKTEKKLMTDFIFWGSKITADGDCSHEIKMFTPWKKSYDQPR